MNSVVFELNECTLKEIKHILNQIPSIHDDVCVRVYDDRKVVRRIELELGSPEEVLWLYTNFIRDN